MRLKLFKIFYARGVAKVCPEPTHQWGNGDLIFADHIPYGAEGKTKLGAPTDRVGWRYGRLNEECICATVQRKMEANPLVPASCPQIHRRMVYDISKLSQP